VLLAGTTSVWCCRVALLVVDFFWDLGLHRRKVDGGRETAEHADDNIGPPTLFDGNREDEPRNTAPRAGGSGGGTESGYRMVPTLVGAAREDDRS